VVRRKKNFLVIGLGNFGMSVAKSLGELEQEVLAADSDPEVVDKAQEFVEHVVQLDATDVEALRTLGIPDFDVCVVGRGTDLADSVLITTNLKELGAKHIAAKALSQRQAKILRQVGADEIVFPEWDMGKRFADHLVRPDVMEHMALWGESGYVVEEIRVPAAMAGKTLAQLGLRTRYAVNVLAVMKDGIPAPLPSGEDLVPGGAVLLVLGTEETIDRLRRDFG